MNVEEKKLKHFGEKSHSVFEGFKGAPSNTLKKNSAICLNLFFNIYDN